MTQRIRNTSWALAALAALLLMPGCVTTDPGHDPQARVATVEWGEFTHQVAFQPGQSRLTASAARGIDRFLAREKVESPDRVQVMAHPDLANEKRDRLAARREAEVVKHLRRRGLAPRVEAGGQAGPPVNGGGVDSVTVVVRRPVVSTPHCPDWERMMAGRELDPTNASFGCITTTSLGAMVANPDDLIEGRDPGTYDGDALAPSIDRYRKGKTRELEDINTSKGK